MEGIVIRPAVAGDLPALTRIYNHYVEATHVTFDVTPFAVDDRRAWFDGFATEGPHRLLVAARAGDCVAYASSQPFRSKPGYASSVETTVYVDPDHLGRRIGRRLYEALFEALGTEDLHRAYAGIALPNPASIALHEGLGFALIGTFGEVGRKFGRFWSVSWYERPIVVQAS